jgi:hypothetical protein
MAPLAAVSLEAVARRARALDDLLDLRALDRGAGAALPAAVVGEEGGGGCIVICCCCCCWG